MSSSFLLYHKNDIVESEAVRLIERIQAVRRRFHGFCTHFLKGVCPEYQFRPTSADLLDLGMFEIMMSENVQQGSAVPGSSGDETLNWAGGSITLNVNGRDYSLNVEPRVTLLDALRERLNLTGSKKGCDHGQCGACTVHINGRRNLSCLTLAVMHQGDQITTIEGLEENGDLHPMQRAFIKHDGFQCGFCTSGQIMSATGLVSEGHAHTPDEIRELMSGNICRCGAYEGIVAAISEVMQEEHDAAV